MYWSSQLNQNYFINKPANQLMLSWINDQEPQRVIDCGCGYGRNILHFEGKSRRLVAFDPCETSVNYIKSISAQVEVSLNRIQDQPRRDDTFDLCIVDGVIHQLLSAIEFDAALKYLHTISSSHGTIFISTFTSDQLSQDLEQLEHKVYRSCSTPAMRLLTSEEILQHISLSFKVLRYKLEKFTLSVGERSNLSCLLRRL